MSDASLQAFNADQRGAVDHGVAGSGTNVAAPLLFIARHGRRPEGRGNDKQQLFRA